jgi:hypothetical protein
MKLIYSNSGKSGIIGKEEFSAAMANLLIAGRGPENVSVGSKDSSSLFLERFEGLYFQKDEM